MPLRHYATDSEKMIMNYGGCYPNNYHATTWNNFAQFKNLQGYIFQLHILYAGCLMLTFYFVYKNVIIIQESHNQHFKAPPHHFLGIIKE